MFYFPDPFMPSLSMYTCVSDFNFDNEIRCVMFFWSSEGGMMGCVTRGCIASLIFKYFDGTAPTESYGSAVLFNKVGPFIPPLAIFFPFHKFSCPYGFLFDTSIETMSHCARVIPKACFINLCSLFQTRAHEHEVFCVCWLKPLCDLV